MPNNHRFPGPDPGAASSSSSVPDAPRPGLIREFEGLRGILAIWVVFVHAMLLSGMVLHTQEGMAGLISRNFVKGQHGVAVFFILSGFVVSMHLERRPKTTVRFMTNRFFRIYPLYLMSLAIGTITVYLMPEVLETSSWFRNGYFDSLHSVSSQERNHLHWHLLFHFLLIQAAVPNAWFPEAQWTILAPAWSLSHEWQFYLIAPRLRRAAQSPIGLVAVAVCVLVASRLAGRFRLGLDWSLISSLPLFLIGILTYRHHERISSRPEIKFAEAVTPLCALAAFALIANWKVVPIAIWTLIYATVVASDRSPGKATGKVLAGISRLLKGRVSLWLGGLSYCIYLMHWPFMIIVLAIASKLAPEMTSAQAFGIFAASAPLLLWICHLIHVKVENPLNAWGKKVPKTLGHYPDTIVNKAQPAASGNARI